MIVVYPLGGHPRPDLLWGAELGTKFGLGQPDKPVLKKSACRNDGRKEQGCRHGKYEKQSCSVKLHDITRSSNFLVNPTVGPEPCQGTRLASKLMLTL